MSHEHYYPCNDCNYEIDRNEIKNELAKKLYDVLDEFDDLMDDDVQEVLNAGRAYFRTGRKIKFEEHFDFDV